MAKFTRTLAAGAGLNLDVSGTGIMMKGTTDTLRVLPDNRNAYREMTGGDKWTLRDPVKDPTFKSLHIVNGGAASATFTIEVFSAGNDEFESKGNDVTIPTSEVALDTVSDGSVSLSVEAELAAADATRKMISIQPRGGDIYIRKGGGTASSTNGIKIADGQLYELNYSGQVRGIAAAGTVPVWVEELY